MVFRDLNSPGLRIIFSVESSWWKCSIFVRSINTGVPQGFILGPLMFIIYFNDLPDHVTHGDIIQYADDTVMFFADKKVETIQKALNEDMEQIGEYCRENELLLNLKKGKTEVMLFGTAQRLRQQKENLEIVYNNTVLNFVTEYLYLGNILDNHLTLAKNFNCSFKRASNRLRLLQYVRRNLTENSAALIYKSMILLILLNIRFFLALLKRLSMTRRMLNMNRWKDVPQTLLDRTLFQRLKW